MRVNPDLYDKLRDEACNAHIFESGREFDDFALGTLVSREVSYRAQGKKFNARHLLLDELENLVDQLAEIKDDYQRKRNKRKR